MCKRKNKLVLSTSHTQLKRKIAREDNDLKYKITAFLSLKMHTPRS